MTKKNIDQTCVTPLPSEETSEGRGDASEVASFPIVGVVASAGGLEAFTQLLKTLPYDTGMAFFLVQHLASPDASALTEILSKATKMPVTDAQKGSKVEPNHVYVIPSARSMIIAGNTLQLLPREAANEEMPSRNEELSNRNAELNRVNNDLVNLIGSVQSAVVMLGMNLCIRRFSPSAETLLNLIPSDIGRPLVDIKFHLDGLPDLESLLKEVLDKSIARECDVRDKQGRWYSLRLRPYRTVDNVIDGVVVTLVDVDAVKRAHEHTESIVATVREPLLVLDKDLRVQSASRSFYETFQVSPEDTINRPLFELGNGQWNIPDLRRLLVDVLPNENEVTDFEMKHDFESIGRKSMRLNARRLIQAADQVPLILLAIEDITERHLVQHALLDSEQRFRVILESLPAAVYTTDAAGRLTHANRAAFDLAGQPPAYCSGQQCMTHTMFHFEGTESPLDECPMATTFRNGVAVRGEEFIVERPDGTRRWVEAYPTPLLGTDGQVTGGVNMLVDITDRKQVEAVSATLSAIVRSSGDAIISTTLDGIITSWNESAVTLFGHTEVEAIGESIFLIVPDELRAEEELLLNRVRHGEKVLNFETERRTKDGRTLNISLTVSPITTAAGKVIGASKIASDITETRRAAVVIKAQNERLVALSEAATGLLFATDPDVMLRGLLARIGSPLGVDAYLNYLVDDSGTTLRLASSDGISAETADTIERLEFGEALCGTAALERQPQVANHVQQSDDPRTESAKSFGFRVYCAYPMISDNVLLGTLSFGSRSKDSFDADELIFLQTISNYIAVAYSRRRAQEVIRKSEERLRFILDSMPQKIFTTNPEGHIDYFNPQWTVFTGMSFEEMQNSGWTHFVHPDDLPQKTELWRHAFATGEPFQSEHRFRRADGQYRWHFSRATPLRDETGRILMWVGSNTDVHDIKLSEAALRDSETRFRRLFEAAKDGVLILDFHSGRIIDANPFMSTLLGYSNDEFLGKELWEIGLLSDKVANESAVEEIQEKGYLRFEHLPLKSNDGRLVEVEVVANAYQEDHHSVIQCNIRDITDRSLLEEALRRQAVQLSDLHRRKDEFLAMLSHELRSPLAPISNAVQLLGLHRASESRVQQQARSIIERQLRQLQHLVDDLLEVSRITSGRVQLRKERVAICKIVEGAVETVRPLIEQRLHELTVSLPSEPSWLQADAARLEQVIVNLLTNAAKYTEVSGHIELMVSVEGRVMSGEKEETSDDSLATPSVVIRIRDTGIGIAPELLPHIFDLFTQAERSLDRSQGGLGIGLALVQRLTELHGGTVEAHSTVGQGSEFILRLPQRSDEWSMASGEQDHLGHTPSASPSALATPLRVLVVDDNVDTVLSLSMLLRASGHEVQTAHDGLAAVQAAIDYKPDVMLLDIGLPGLNGHEVAKRIRQHPTLKKVVLVAMTGYGQDSDRQISQQAGFNHHLVKPARLDRLQKILATVSEQLAVRKSAD